MRLPTQTSTDDTVLFAKQTRAICVLLMGLDQSMRQQIVPFHSPNITICRLDLVANYPRPWKICPYGEPNRPSNSMEPLSLSERPQDCVSHFQPIKRVLKTIFFASLLGTVFAPLRAVAQNQPIAVRQFVGDFTLKYAAKELRSRTPADREDEYQIVAQGIDMSLKQGGMTASAADKARADLRERTAHDPPPNKFSVVLSCRNGKMLYRIDGSRPTVLIWDGKYSYVYDERSAALKVRTGFGFESATLIPCPAVGLPGIPLIKLPTSSQDNLQVRGDVFTGFIFPTGPYYLPGSLHFVKADDGAMHLTAGEWRESGLLRGRYEFSGTSSLGPMPIAHQIHIIQYLRTLPPDPKKKPQVFQSDVYELVSSSASGIPDEQFNPTAYFPVSTNDRKEPPRPFINWTVSNRVVTFHYDPSKTLVNQLRDAIQLEKSEAEQIYTLQNKRRGIGGPVLLALLLAGVAFWLLRRKAVSR